ncbi:hypothetical protein CAOG_010028 [Capsaspora owczarzaki ATCC 30864]|uniref:Uncharacterized protein n=1 Tax=Capsaspora owczarzaki (strain ATCC 30864) TaxID=595528 RepID=A0A0D2X4S0_CAPO3|nr:hypothetical protein CAOG_010028 [Capsaspora owczarzaki ATCC 30864]
MAAGSSREHWQIAGSYWLRFRASRSRSADGCCPSARQSWTACPVVAEHPSQHRQSQTRHGRRREAAAAAAGGRDSGQRTDSPRFRRWSGACDCCAWPCAPAAVVVVVDLRPLHSERRQQQQRGRPACSTSTRPACLRAGSNRRRRRHPHPHGRCSAASPPPPPPPQCLVMQTTTATQRASRPEWPSDLRHSARSQQQLRFHFHAGQYLRRRRRWLENRSRRHCSRASSSHPAVETQ